MTPYEQYAGDLARTQRDALTFSPTPIVGIPHDPIAHADRDVSMLVLDLNVAIRRATTVETVLRLNQHIREWRQQLATLELSALVRANDLLNGKD